MITKEEGLELYVDMVLGKAVYDVCTQMCHGGNMFGFLLLYSDERRRGCVNLVYLVF